MIHDRMQKEAMNLLKTPYSKPDGQFTPTQASDEIITLFCMLHGGIEEAMPIVKNQFFRSYVDFDNPSKAGLKKVAEGLVGVTHFLKGKDIADLTKKRFQLYLNNTKDD